jgi:hypothetical protein
MKYNRKVTVVPGKSLCIAMLLVAAAADDVETADTPAVPCFATLLTTEHTNLHHYLLADVLSLRLHVLPSLTTDLAKFKLGGDDDEDEDDDNDDAPDEDAELSRLAAMLLSQGSEVDGSSDMATVDDIAELIDASNLQMVEATVADNEAKHSLVTTTTMTKTNHWIRLHWIQGRLLDQQT